MDEKSKNKIQFNKKRVRLELKIKLNKMKNNNKYKTTKSKNIYNYNPTSNHPFGTTNPEIVKKIYNHIFSMDLNKKLIELTEKSEEYLDKGDIVSSNKCKSETHKLSDEKILCILENKSKIKKYFNYLSYLNKWDKKNKDGMFFNTYYLNIFAPFTVSGNKNKSWFNDFYDFISELPSIYTNVKGFHNSGTELFRMMEEDEFFDISINGFNKNPSWSSNNYIYEKFFKNPLYNGKTYTLVGSSFFFNDILFDSRYEDRLKNDFSKGSGESECFIRKNAKTINHPLPIFSIGYSDILELYPFIPDGFRLDGTKTMNGFNTTNAVFDSFEKSEIEKYGYLTLSNYGEKTFLPYDLSKSLEKKIEFEEGLLTYDETRLDYYREVLENTISNTTYYNRIKGLIKNLKNRVKDSKSTVNSLEKTLELYKNNDYEFGYGVSNEKEYDGINVPVYYFPKTKAIFSSGISMDISKGLTPYKMAS